MRRWWFVLLLIIQQPSSIEGKNVTKSEDEDESCAAAAAAKTWDDQCRLSKSEDCDSDYASAYFCSKSSGGRAMLLLVYVCWLVLLFSLLGSTADEYFSPALEQLSTDFGLPPRFAGVTLLALGNGAPDVSSTIHAVSSNRSGYRLALGALTGAGMFVGTVVAGAVMVVGGGAKAKGALLRDVTAYLGTCGIVVFLIGSVQRVSYAGVTLLLVCYTMFVSIVLAADLWHRRPGGPAERQARLAEAQAAANRDGGDDDETPAIELLLTLIHSVRRPDYHHDHDQANPLTSDEIAAIEGDDEPDLGRLPARRLATHNPDDHELDHAVASSSSSQEKVGGGAQPYVVIDGDASPQTTALDMGGTETLSSSLLGTNEVADSEAAPGGLRGPGSSSGMGPPSKSKYDDTMTIVALAMECWERSVDHTLAVWSLPMHQLVLAVGELPFVLMRRATVPLTCDDSYARGPLVGSCVCAPIWLAFYASQRGADGGVVGYVVAACLGTGLAIAVAMQTHAGKELPDQAALGLSLFGFAVAATWIDVLADQLVSLLQFIGDLVAIPETALGLTVLAWGNSIGDFSTNIAMAKKGLSNMSMTACFAGPLFNALVGLGLGFAFRISSSDVDDSYVDVSLNPALYTGFTFLCLNCIAILTVALLNKGQIPKQFGFLSIAIYVTYISVSLSLLL